MMLRWISHLLRRVGMPHEGHTCHAECDHQDDDPNRGNEFSLYLQVSLDHIRCLNEAVDGSAKKVFKPWDERFDQSTVLQSDCDEQLILFIPFTGQVKLKSIAVLGLFDEAPASMKAFVNREDVDFDSVDSMTPDQEWELAIDVPRNSLPEYPTRMSKFSGLRNLTLFFPSNVSGSDVTKITYIGLKGEWTPLNKDPIITMYEAAANPADHKTKAEDMVGRAIQ